MPQTVFDVRDPITSRLKLNVTPDVSTTATVVVYRPDGTVINSVTVSGWTGVDGDEKTAQWFATDDGSQGSDIGEAAGDWLAIWTVTGTGASTTPKIYPVTPLPGTSTRPTWSPFLSDVADYVPALTVDMTAPGSQVYLGTFTGRTSPTDEQAQRHVDAAASLVGAGFSVLTDTGLIRMARTVTAITAAASLARAFIRDDTGADLAAGLERQAAAALKVLLGAVENAGSTTLSAVPVLIAPDPVLWGDWYL